MKYASNLAKVLSVPALMFSLHTHAQTITDVIPEIGDTYILDVDFGLAGPGASGSGTVWDFGDMEFINPTQGQVLAASSVVGGGAFPSHAISLTQTYGIESSSNTFMDFSDGDWVYLGWSSLFSTGTSTIVAYDEPHEQFATPLFLSASGSGTFAYSDELFVYTVLTTGTSDWEVDGSGTLILPNATYEDVLRVRVSTVESSVMEDPIQNTPYANITTTTYYWMKEGIPHYLAMYMEQEYEDLVDPWTDIFTTSQALIGYNVTSTDESEPEYAKFHPNPVDGYAEVTLLPEFGKPLSYAVYDSRGKLVLEGNLAGYPGQAFRVDMGGLPPGSYVFQIRGAQNVTHAKFIKN